MCKLEELQYEELWGEEHISLGVLPDEDSAFFLVMPGKREIDVVD